MEVVLEEDLFSRQIVLLWQTSEIVNNLKTSYYGNFSIWKRRDSYNRCSIDFMLSGCKT
ncbi:hypothetical protein [uncultured Draconibacterium sp.]|uniref:hypothetical protein n=1 Tax=uncultured Draconibacterium sp. TaxID=1573823 RepID=UPI0029C8E954|nr:hypothetical protein [uncultured Draconibacterium sp.]